MPRKCYSIIFALLLAVWPRLSQAQTAPEPPTNVQVVALEGAQAARITWQASAAPGATYRIYRSQTSDSNGNVIVLSLSELAYTDTNVVFNSTYYYRLAAVLADVESQLSSQVSVKPLVPVPINAQAADTQKGGEIKISWERSAPGLLLKFNVYRSTTDSSLGGSVVTNFEGTEYFDATVTNDSYYYYRVAAVYANGQQSEPSALVIGRASDAAPPEKPTISASASEGGRVAVSWSTPRNEQSLRYFVYRSGSSGEVGTLVMETTSTSFNESALNPNQTLYYRVIAKDGAGNVSSASEPARVVTIGASGAARQQFKVSDFTVEGTINRGEIQLRWKLPNNSDIIYSRVYRRLSPSSPAAMIADKVYGGSFLDKTAAGSQRYYYFIRLVDKNGYEFEAGTEVSAAPFTEPSIGSVVDNAPEAKAPPPAQANKVKTSAPVKAYAYGRPRMTNLKLEAALGSGLRKQLVKKLGAKKVPTRLSPVLVRAYIYGGYVIDEIAHTVVNGPGLVHPSIRAVEWRKSAEYKSRTIPVHESR